MQQFELLHNATFPRGYPVTPPLKTALLCTPYNRPAFAAVIGDAALIAEVIDVDTHGRDPRAVPGAPAPPRADAGAFSSSLPPTQREIEGAGGEMWYEARHIGAGRAA